MVWTIDLTRNGLATRLTTDAARDFASAFSPDGKRIAFNSSRVGGLFVEELFFLAPDGTMMAANLVSTTPFERQSPAPLFKTAFAAAPHNRPYVVSRDGQRFLLPIPLQSPEPSPLTVIINWPARLRQQGRTRR